MGRKLMGMKATPGDERALMRGWTEGNLDALSALYDRLAPILFPLALRIVGSRERACCVVEDVFEEMWRDRERWRGESAVPEPGLIARCRELALAHVADGHALAAIPVSDGHGDVTVPSPRQTALEALAAMPEPDRRALEEAYFRGTNARDVAILLGTPTSDAEAMLRRALVRFRGLMDDGVAAGAGSEAGA